MVPHSDGDDDLPLDALLAKQETVTPNENNNGNKDGPVVVGASVDTMPVIPYTGRI
jgi:hypothetical protein